MARDIHAEITETIVAQLRQGIRPWMRPWETGRDGDYEGAGLPMRETGEPYSGINILVLWAAAIARGYKAPTWMTFHQAIAHGGAVRKGEKGERVVYASRFTKKTVDPETGREETRELSFHKTYTVFNVEQIDGLDARWYRSYAELRPFNSERRTERLDGFFEDLDIDLRHGGDDAYYVLSEDYIQMPPFELFHDAESYYTTLAHESVHWTRHESRLKRRFRNTKPPGSAYAMEELVAEIGSAFLSAELGIAPSVREDHADYIGAWLRVLEGDNRAIFTAASHASKAVTWLTNHARRRDVAAPSEEPVAPIPLPIREKPPVTTWVQGSLFRGVPDEASGRAFRSMSMMISEAIGSQPAPIAVGTMVGIAEGDGFDDTGEVVAMDGEDVSVHWRASGTTETLARAGLADLVVTSRRPGQGSEPV